MGQQLHAPTTRELRCVGPGDYLDFAALADRIGDEDTVAALRSFDDIYPQPNGESALQQLHIQLASPLPYDLSSVQLSIYKNPAPRWHDWSAVELVCAASAILIFDRIIGCSDAEKP
jgi:hypothetical protein